MRKLLLNSCLVAVLCVLSLEVSAMNRADSFHTILSDKRGLISEADAVRLKEFADYRKLVFASDKIKDGMGLWCAVPQNNWIYCTETETFLIFYFNHF